MKKTILIFVSLTCFAAIASVGSSMAEEMLIQDSGNETTVNISALYSSGFLGVAEAVKFTPPKAGWILDSVQILGWDGYEENGTLPDERMICMEIRDENLRLLYRFTDSQLPYFTFSGMPGMGVIEVPSLPMNGDFYVCFYDRGAVDIGLDWNKVEGNSFFYDMMTGELIPAEVGTKNSEELIPVNWIIRAAGR
ncbi:MAG TPA: hypothetical protein PLJ69_06150 [Methanothrix sp.]|nr:hypothetical protein [Methanothrix sp.]